MAKISIQSLTKSFGGRDVLRDFSLEIAAGSRVSVVGPNGCGKSTLLRLIAGESEADAGRISLSAGARLGYVVQELTEKDLETNLCDFVLSGLPSWSTFWEKWHKAVAAKDERTLAALSEEQTRLETMLGYNPEHRAMAILNGLGFEDKTKAEPVRHLSGGWRERAKLARVLVAGADILLLDEPTNHLDLEAVEWLEQYLLCYKGVLVFVAHDRIFLDRIGTSTLFLGEERPIYRSGNLTEFLAWRKETEEQRMREAANLEARIKRQMMFVDRFRYKATKARQAQSKLKNAERLGEELAKMQEAATKAPKTLAFRLPQPRRSDKTVLSVAELEFGFEPTKPLWSNFGFNLYRGQKVALVGKNGAGKTTLLKLISGHLKPWSGQIRMGSNTDMAYFSQHQTEILNTEATVMSEIKRLSDPKTTHEELCSVLGLFLLGESFFERRVASLSGGEKSRLVLASLFLSRSNFFVMDEPTNHLDLESREGLVQALLDFEGTILFVAHDRYLLSEVAEEVWAISPHGVDVHLGGFADYERALKEEAAGACSLADDGQNTATDSGRPGGRKDDKERKRRIAEERNAIYRQLKPLRSEYEKLEVRLETVLAEQTSMEEIMADPDTYADAARFTELSKSYHALGEESEQLLERMDALESDMKRLEMQREALGAE
ncbi:ribosomal protection-like ABC-F family protein [Desulfovibrio inopinatus]|uniref:ribosomal protection-like ABC-F family protein n=1 Tax=Desulfovibrio inopinatus TaxID=102109 RepID=UPI00041B80AB|nr:ABC-F family ATP-binding cassette domain-containing protein [Desulfovibrio inopinatus]